MPAVCPTPYDIRTPIVNTLSDAYGLFRFLRIRPWYDWEEFNGKIARVERKNRKTFPSVIRNLSQA